MKDIISKRLRRVSFIMAMITMCSAMAACEGKNQQAATATPGITPSATIAATQLTGYKHFLEKAKAGETINVAFLGGSITAGASYANWGTSHTFTGINIDGTAVDTTQYWSYKDDMRDSWRGRVFTWLKTTYAAKTDQFVQINAAIGGTDSTFGALRLEDHVFAQGIPDLIFIEFAVNDNGKSQKEMMQAYESIVNRVLEKNPDCAIFIALSTSRQKSDRANPAAYDLFLTSAGYAKNYANYRKIPYANIDDAYYHSDLTAAQMTALYIGPKDDAGVHPSPYGYEVYAAEVIRVLKSCFADLTFTFEDIHLAVPAAYPENGKIIFGEDILSAMFGSKAVALTDDPRQHKCLSYHKMLQNTDVTQQLTYSFQGTGLWLWTDSTYCNAIMDVYVDDIKVLSFWSQSAGQQIKFVKGYLKKDVVHTVRIVPIGTADSSRKYSFALRGLLIENYAE